MAEQLVVYYIRESSPGQALEGRYGPQVQRNEIAALAAEHRLTIDHFWPLQLVWSCREKTSADHTAGNVGCISTV